MLQQTGAVKNARKSRVEIACRLTKIVGLLGLNVEGGGKRGGVSCNCLLETQKIIERE